MWSKLFETLYKTLISLCQLKIVQTFLKSNDWFKCFYLNTLYQYVCWDQISGNIISDIFHIIDKTFISANKTFLLLFTLQRGKG
jgi:hypothetical protein